MLQYSRQNRSTTSKGQSLTYWFFYLHILDIAIQVLLDLSLSFLFKHIAKSSKHFFVIFLFDWRASCSFLIFQAKILITHIFEGINQILKLNLNALHELSLLLVTYVLILPCLGFLTVFLLEQPFSQVYNNMYNKNCVIINKQ